MLWGGVGSGVLGTFARGLIPCPKGHATRSPKSPHFKIC
ncbi:hypothetical protein COO91_04391 [Nostoc flagelliforme CCNUN1]|uniref:Uncharacterized protein n=1 Tax=Nostoc flagelliforme CCNUN1 TaxID=2038116 RepID=A0A2K8SSM1_9NOSO|nr:hypothetical protein COO91_04391 [Nostoc flagelliforme CCNUN1]